MFLFLLSKLKSFLLLVLNIIRRAFCCFRRRRRHSKDEPLSHIVVSENASSDVDQSQWNDWEFKNRKPASVEEHIEYYRQQQAKLRQAQEAEEQAANDEDLFQDMMPQITRQKKVLIGQEGGNRHKRSLDMSLTAGDGVKYTTNELENWDENTGWENEALEVDAGELLKQKKREERERRVLEQQQRRSEKTNRPLLGAKLVT